MDVVCWVIKDGMFFSCVWSLGGWYIFGELD